MSEQPEQFDAASANIIDELKAKLKLLFPEIITEGGKIDFDRLKLTLGETVDTGKERYGMNWPGKAECFKTIQRPSMATLVPARDESVNFDTTENLICEGDNLETLKLLQKAYLGKVKMIFIDPPYNTGNDFIYPDDFAESLETYLRYTGQADEEGRKFSTNSETDGRFHSKWLNMMYPRLFLARNLLRQDGVIFISIDDAELDNLKKIGNEVFGEDNFIGSAVWQHSIQPKGYTGKFSVHHNYILCFRKSDAFELANLERTDEHNKNYSNPDNDPKGLWRTGDVRNSAYRPNLIYDIITPSGKIISPPANGWRWSKETVQKKIATGEIKFSADETRIIRKIYLEDLEGRTPETIWFGKDVGTTRDAATELKELFDGNSPFDTPKPTLLIRHMLRLGTAAESGDIVLDFFAGSGTTGHAVLAENNEDGGNRRFILVQLPEPAGNKDFPTIADITKERVRRVTKKLNGTENNQLSMGNIEAQDRGFKVFKLQSSNFKAWNADQPKDDAELGKQLTLHVDHLVAGRTQEDVLYELLLKSGFPLTTKVENIALAGKSVFSIANGGMLICLEKELTSEVIKAMAEMKPERVVCLDVGFAENDQLKTNAVQTMKAKGVTKFQTV
jgi:adenine-specific DNA-methyltransferase